VADGGTLLLDEIGEMESTIQAKLLKVLEGGRFRRVGGVAEIEVDVRLIAATHRDLDAEVEAGSFRRDLLFRLNVFSIRLPSLRERTEEILPLAQLFFREHRGDADGESLISDDAAERLQSYAWPGNVRELRNVMERAAILCPAGSPLTSAHLPPLETAAAKPSLQPAPDSVRTMKDSERFLIEHALRKNGGNILVTARELGISRGTLYRKAKMYGIVVIPGADPT
jgi:DNA-binding NtrC family response regulator